MRPGGFGIFLPYLPSLCLLGIPLAYALVRAGAARFGLPPGRLGLLCIVLLFPVAFVFALGFIKQFLVLGRHLTPLFPFILCALAYALSHLWASRRLLDRLVVSWIVIALAASALECRFAYRHEKDDNKNACALAKTALAQGEQVWWVADIGAATYYGLPFSPTAQPGSVLLLWKPTLAELAAQKPPALIILSKPDLFDPNSAARDFIKQQGYTQVGALPAFSIWRK
jgi:hypothetical protein